MTLDATKIQFASNLGAFQNSLIVNQSFSVSAHTFSDGSEQLLTFNIPTSHGENVSQVQVDFSFDPNKRYIAPLPGNTIAPSPSTKMLVFANYTPTNLVITLDIIPVGSSPWSYPAFTFDVKAKIFITPTPIS